MHNYICFNAIWNQNKEEKLLCRIDRNDHGYLKRGIDVFDESISIDVLKNLNIDQMNDLIKTGKLKTGIFNLEAEL